MAAGPGYIDPETKVYMLGESDVAPGNMFSELINKVTRSMTTFFVTVREEARTASAEAKAASAAAKAAADAAAAVGASSDAQTASNLKTGPQSSSALTTAIGQRATVKGAAGLYSADYVQVGTTDHTSELQQMIADAAAGRTRAGIKPGTYVAAGLVLPEYAALDGWGAGLTRFPSDANKYRYGAVTIKRKPGSTEPVLTLEGGGARVTGISFDGDGGTAPVFRQRGFESEIRSVRIINAQGVGFDVQGANNTRWSDINVDDCGSATEPAVRFSSPVLPSGKTTINTLDCYGLTIERQHGDVALEIAYGASDVDNWAEWVRISHLHIEASHLDHPNTVQPLIAVGNVRQLTLENAFVYGGPAVLLRHNQRANRAYGNGGVTLIGGSFNGSDVVGSGGAVAATPTLIELQAGDKFAAIGTSFMRYSVRAIAALADYGPVVAIDPSCFMYGPGTTDFTDQRAGRTAHKIRGDARVTGHISSARVAAPAVSFASGITTPNDVPAQALLPASSDVAGMVSFGTTAAPPAAGLLATITFDRPYTRQPSVTPGACTRAAAKLGIYMAVSQTELKIYADNAPAASQALGTYQISYTVIGLDV